jgi:hypothetical protein
MVCPTAIGEKNKTIRKDGYVTLFRAREKSRRDYQEGNPSKAKTRLGLLAGEWAVEGRPSFLSPQLGVHNKEVQSTVKTTAGRW